MHARTISTSFICYLFITGNLQTMVKKKGIRYELDYSVI